MHVKEWNVYNKMCRKMHQFHQNKARTSNFFTIKFSFPFISAQEYQILSIIGATPYYVKIGVRTKIRLSWSLKRDLNYG